MPFGLTIVKTFPYRGAPEEFSNTYWFTGQATPADNAAWLAFATKVANSEKQCYSSQTQIVRYYGYTAPGTKAAFVYDFVALNQAKITGTGTQGSDGQSIPGDSAIQMRALCGQASTGRNKYLRKYFHAGACVNGNPDQVSATYIASVGAHATKLTDGSLDGGAKWSNEAGAVGTFPYVGRFITTRTLKRRGKRPS